MSLMTTLLLTAVLLWLGWILSDVLGATGKSSRPTVLLSPVTDWVFVWVIVCVVAAAWLFPLALAAAPPLVATAAAGVTTAGIAL